jgi:hypothetical protein
MSSAISFGPLTPEQLSSALTNEFLGRIPNGSTVVFNYGSSTAAKEEGNTQSGSTSPAVIISFSPAATTAINRARVALQVITRDRNQKSAQPRLHAPATVAKTETDRSAIADPRNSGTSRLDQYRQMSVTDRFYATADLDQLISVVNPDQKADFLTAYKSGTLNIQNAPDVPLLDYKETWTVSKTAGGGGSERGSFSGAVNQQYGQQYLVMSSIFGGGMFVSWGSQPNTDNAVAETPSVPSATVPAG